MRRHDLATGRLAKRARRVRNCLSVELLETRQLLSTYTVTNTDDTTSTEVGTLRWAITQVNGDPTTDVIDFKIPTAGVQEIELAAALPQITKPVLIDGTSQTDYQGKPLIAIDGSKLSAGDAVLWVTAGSSTIQGLAIVNSVGTGIELTSAGSNVVQSNYIGTSDGTTAGGNASGLTIDSSSNTIGGSTAAAGNVISASSDYGISIGGTTAVDDNLVEGNEVGVDVTGAVAMPNVQGGILLDNAGSNLITQNVISGSKGNLQGSVGDGILIQVASGPSSDNQITLNEIGTTASGQSALGNALNGIEINGAAGSTISGNVISGNLQDGILLDSLTTGTLIRSNEIGTNSGGTAAIANGIGGIAAYGTAGTTIGGANSSLGNLISGNTSNGIVIGTGAESVDATATLIEGNVIGLTSSSNQILSNGGAGIDTDGSNDVTIGGTAAGARNIISGNRGAAIALASGSGAVIEGNYIGTDGTGVKAEPNEFGIVVISTTDVTIGGTAAGAGNVISGNTATGIDLNTSGVSGQLVEGNLIGVNATDSGEVGNGNAGVEIFGPQSATVGGTALGAGNVISGNGADGIQLVGSGFANDVIEGNEIGTDATGTLKFGNARSGVLIDVGGNTIGGTSAAAANIIANNGQDGISLEDSDSTGNSFLGNSIYGNGELGISFSGTDTPTTNHPDGFIGAAPNNFQNYPLLTSATNEGSSVEIVGTLNALPSTSYVVQFFASATADSTGYGQGELYLGETTVTTGTNYNAAIDATLTASVPTNWVISATATDPGGDTSEFSPDLVTKNLADVGVLVTSNAPVNVGGTLIYTVTVTNSGPSDATGVTVSDTFTSDFVGTPTATASESGVVPQISGSTMTADIGVLALDGSVTITISLVPSLAAAPSVSDTATVSDTSVDTDTSNKSDTIVSVIDSSADLSLAIVPSVTSVYVGGQLTYTLTVTDNGPSAATGVSISDTLPANVTFISATGGITPTGNTLTFNIGALALNASSSVSFIISPNAAAVPSISDTATVLASTEDPLMSNNTVTSAATTVVPSADLQVVVTAGTSPVSAEDDETYTIVATNNGPSPATNVLVSDTIPADVTFVSATGGLVPSLADAVTFSIASLANGSSATFHVTVQVLGTSASPTTDVASISGGQSDPISSNNTSTTSVVITPVSNLSLTLGGLPATVEVGKDLTYTLTATNSGPSADPDVVVVDTLPSNVSFISDSGGILPSSGVITFEVGSLPAGASSTIKIVVIPSPTAAGSGIAEITDSATISGEYNATVSSPVTATNEVQAVAALSVVVTAPTSTYVDQSITYLVTITNAGPSSATGVSVLDTLPSTGLAAGVQATTSLVGVTPTVAGNLVTADFGTIAALTTVTMTITVVPNAATPTNSPIVDTASATLNVEEVDPDSTTSSVDTTVLPLVSLALTPIVLSTPQTVEYGSPITYSMVITNSGPSVATNLIVTSPLAANTTFSSGVWASAFSVPATGTVTQSGANLVADIGTLPVGDSATISFTIVPLRAAVGDVELSATAAANESNSDAAGASTSGSAFVLDQPGTFDLSSTQVLVSEFAGVADFTVVRVGGLAGQVSIGYATNSISATPLLDYTPVSGTLVFPAGVASETIQVPVLADPYDNHNELVGITLSNPTGGASLGASSTGTLTIVDADPNFTNPVVSNVLWTGSSAAISSVILYFNEPLAATPAGNAANYTLTSDGPDEIFGTGDDQRVSFSVYYNPVAYSVTLTPNQPLSGDQFYRISVNGSTAGGLTDVAGNPFAGAGASYPGTDYVAQFAVGNDLQYYDATGDRVTLTLKGGGYIEDLLSGSGQGGRLIVVDEVAHHSVLKGSVVRARLSAGRPYLGYTVYGLGKFGDVRVRMEAPPFRVTRYPFSPGTPIVQPTVPGAVAKSSTAADVIVKSGKPKARVQVGRAVDHAKVSVGRSGAKGMGKPSLARPFHAF